MTKPKILTSLFWNLLDNIINKGINIFVFILLARLLSPEDFGVLGILMIFITFSKTFVDAGLSQALIKKQNCTDADYNTVLLFNFIIGVVLYSLIYILSPLISDFFNLQKLTTLIRLASIVILIGSLSVVQQTILTKNLYFKTQALISFVATFFSGIIAIYLAYNDFGIYSLIWRTIIFQAIFSILLWFNNKWLPKLVFDFPEFFKMLKFSYKILLSITISDLFNNIYNIVIGKFYSTKMLGFYTTANNYSGIIPFTINAVLGKVIYPAFVNLHDNNLKLKTSTQKITKAVMFLTFYVMFLIVAIARPLFEFALGEKWMDAVVYFQILCLGYMMLPLIPLNHTILYIKGRSDLVLITDVIKYLTIIPFIGIGLYYGIFVLVLSSALFWWISFIVCAMFTKKMIQYSIKEQIIDISPYFIISAILGIVVYAIDYLSFINNNFLTVMLQTFTSLILFYITNEFLKLEIYLEGKSFLVTKLKSWRKK
jgi:O-antigen/teichoic acid export membrane protein